MSWGTEMITDRGDRRDRSRTYKFYARSEKISERVADLLYEIDPYEFTDNCDGMTQGELLKAAAKECYGMIFDGKTDEVIDNLLEFEMEDYPYPEVTAEWRSVIKELREISSDYESIFKVTSKTENKKPLRKKKLERRRDEIIGGLNYFSSPKTISKNL